MASDGNVRRRPDLWSYISFSRPTSRTGDYALPLNTRRDADDDRFEKPARTDHAHNASESYAYSAGPQKTRLLKYGVGIFFTFVLLYLLTSGSSPRSIISGGQRASAKEAQSTKCTKSYDSSKPLTQYVLMIDAGSSGSRIHVYKFNNCAATPELENELFVETPKKENGGSGLSSYDSDAEGAAASLDMLLDRAMQEVPQAYRSCSPVAVKATAGLRKLGDTKSQRILAAVRERLEKKYPFPVVAEAKGGVEVMDGMDEGVYAWITANYLLGKIGGPDKTPTAAVFDLGGGSTQIVFEPTFPDAANGGMPEKMAEGDHKYKLDFGGHKFELYQHSYLGYGLNEGRKALYTTIVEQALANGQDEQSLKSGLVNPCLAPGTSKVIEVDIQGGRQALSVKMTGPATGSAAQCRAIAEKTLHKEAPCKISPCAFDGVHQPPLAKTFAKEDIYLFSFFYDRIAPLGMPDSFHLSELKDLSHKVCDGEDEWGVFSGAKGALEELRGRPDHCLDLNFMLALLHTGYDMPMDREVRIAKKIGGNELGWCLGASLPLLSQESGWECKIQQVA